MDSGTVTSSVAVCRFLSHSGSSGSKPRPPPQPRRYGPLSTTTSHMCIIKIIFLPVQTEQIQLSIFFYFSASLDEGSSGASMHCGQVKCKVHLMSHTVYTLQYYWDEFGSITHDNTCLQPSSSCSFDGSLKLDQSDSESKWPEIPPVLNQNEDRKKNKYLRKDYLKVKARPHLIVPWHASRSRCETHLALINRGKLWYVHAQLKVSLKYV